MVNRPNIPPVQFNTYGIKYRPPVHRVNPEPTPLEDGPMEGFEVMDINTVLDRTDIIASAELPDVRPVFTGLRRFITEVRIASKQEKVEELARRHNVLHATGTSIIRGEGYLGFDNADRPTTLKERISTNRLERITRRRRQFQVQDSHLKSTNENDRPNRVNTSRQPLTRSEERSIARGRSQALSLSQKNIGLDRKFRKIIGKSGLKAERQIQKRDKLVAKSEALRRAS